MIDQIGHAIAWLLLVFLLVFIANVVVQQFWTMVMVFYTATHA